MDLRTIIRELDELIQRTRSALEHEGAILNGLLETSLRREKQQQIAAMRIQLRRLRRQRSAIKTKRRPTSRLK
jgi:phosphomevalonate kinase